MNGDLKYATDASGSWVATTVDSDDDVGAYTSLALDASGFAHITYFDTTNGDLKYADNTTGVWVAETVDSEGDVGYYSSLKMDADGTAHISYYDNTKGDLKYAAGLPGEECAPKSLAVSPGKLTVGLKKSTDVTVEVKGKDGCPVEGVTVDITISKSDQKKISVSPEEGAQTDSDGKALFTFTGVKKGTVKAVVTAEDLEKKITVKVK